MPVSEPKQRRPGDRAARRPRQRRGGPTAQEIMRERLIESRLTPNAISLTGFALNLLAAFLVVERMFFLAGVAFIVGSIMDTLDGRYSRMSGKGTQFGAFLDSTLDRLEEGIVLIAVAAYFASLGDQIAVAAVVAAVLGSLMVSYTRARAEALGVQCKVGLATRPVRVVILAAGLVFARGASLGDFSLLPASVYLLAGLTLLTMIQRIVHVHRELAGGEEQGADPASIVPARHAAAFGEDDGWQAAEHDGEPRAQADDERHVQAEDAPRAQMGGKRRAV